MMIGGSGHREKSGVTGLSITFKLGIALLVILLPFVVGIAFLLPEIEHLGAAGRVVNLAGLQRMRSQAIVKEALLVASGAGSRATLATLRHQFTDALSSLRAGQRHGGLAELPPYLARFLEMDIPR